MITYLRYSFAEPSERVVCGPKGTYHPTTGMPCPACGKPFAYGDYTTLIPLGPGDDPEAQERAREGQWFNAVATEVHFACATGRPANLADAVRNEGGE